MIGVIYLMLEVQQFTKALKEWKNQNEKQVGDILKRLQTIQMPDQEKSLHALRDTLIFFHKDINKANQVEESWFQDVLKAKKHIKKLQEDFKKAAKAPKLIKKNSQINYPKELFESKDERQKNILMNLYKNFLVNLTEQTAEKTKDIVQFLHRLLDYLYESFTLNKKNIDEENVKKLFERLDKIGSKFLQSSAAQAKVEMINGLKDARLVAELDSDVFISELAKKRREKKEEQLAKRNQIGFYDAMKKNINKDATQQCRKCGKNTAYCEDMKQTRASDEPMTKFMRCNNCNNQWRCE